MLDTQFRKIWADLSTRKGRSILTMIGLFVGLWGIGTVVIAYAILSVDLAENFGRTAPPNIVMELSEPLTTQFDKAPDKLLIENRPIIPARLKVSENGWLPLYLFVVSDFNKLQIAQFFPEQGAWPPPEGSMLIERSSEALLGFYRAQVKTAPDQGVANIRLLKGGSLISQISGTVYDPGLAPSTMERVIYGYISAETAARWTGGTPNGRILSRVESTHRGATNIAAALSYLQQAIAEKGLELRSTTLNAAPEHPHQFQMNSILFLLSGLGSLALLMSMVLAVNLISSLLSNQIRQIGTLKAIGASRIRVGFLYLATMFILGLCTSLLVLPLVIESGFGLSRTLSAMLNFDLLTKQLPLPLYALLVIFGALLPVAAAWLPVRKWSAVSVRDALDNFGFDNRSFSPLLRSLSSPLPHTLRLGVRNSLRQPRRLALTVLILGIGILSFLLATGMRSSLQQTAAAEEAAHRYQISVNFAKSVSPEQIDWIYNSDGARDFANIQVSAVELWQTTRIYFLSNAAGKSAPYPVFGVPADSRALAPNLMEGSWLSPEQANGFVVNNRFAAKYPQLKTGGSYEFSINDRTIRLKLMGTIKEFSGAGVYMGAAALQQITGAASGTGNLVLITLADASFLQQARFKGKLEQQLDAAGLAGRQVQTANIASQIITSHLDVIVALLAFVAAVMLFVSGLGVASGVGTSIIERSHELGALRAMGATPTAIRGILLSESLFMALLAWLLALALSPPIGQYLGAYFGTGIVEYPFDYSSSVSGIYLSLAAAMLVVLVATLAPAQVATKGEISASL
jgi:putative ABC transport system permease protein